MTQKLVPVQVTTWPALYGALKDKYRLLYIDNTLYLWQPAKIMDIMVENGYLPIGRKAKRGIFFYRADNGFVFDPDIHEIHDPMGSL